MENQPYTSPDNGPQPPYAQFLTKYLGASWRTSLTGYATALFAILYPIISNGNFDIKRDWKQCIMAVLAAIWGNVSKDAKVTGLPGSQQPTNTEVNKTN